MKILLFYLRAYRWTVVLVLVLATICQVFSLLDPVITGKIVDELMEKRAILERGEFIKRVFGFIALAVGAAMVSRIAKNLQDYFTSIIVQKTGSQMYSDGLKHSLAMPYQVFEDLRSGETLAILQKVRIDTEKFITSFISIAFEAFVGIVFVVIYSRNISLKVTLVYLTALPFIAIVSWLVSGRIKKNS